MSKINAPIDLTQMTITEVSRHCINLYETAQQTTNDAVRKRLLTQYNDVANFYNIQIAKLKCLQLS